MNILIAPDSFKECLPASKVANSIANGINKINPNHNIEKIPISCFFIKIIFNIIF